MSKYIPREEAQHVPDTTEDGRLKNYMLKINGKAFRCECHCNVFHKPDVTRPDLFECNSCRTGYFSE